MFYTSDVRQVKRRRDEYSDATKQALIDCAIAQFMSRGYAGTSLDDIAADARVTKGALYHYFPSKQALFEAALEQVEAAGSEDIAVAAAGEKDPWQAGIAAVNRFLERCCEPGYARMVMVEGPMALGFSRWRECEIKYAYGLTEGIIRSLVDGGYIDPLPIDATTRMVFGQLSAAALALAEAPEEDRRRVADEMKTVFLRLMEGLRRS